MIYFDIHVDITKKLKDYEQPQDLQRLPPRTPTTDDWEASKVFI